MVANGTRISLRQVGADDHAALAALFARLTPESRYQRFLSPKCELTPRELTFVTDIDHPNHEAIAAVDQRDNSIVGVARSVRDADRTEVADAFQRMGIGTALASLTNDRALANGLRFLTATTLWENPAARRLLRRHGFRSRQRRRGTIDDELKLEDFSRSTRFAGQGGATRVVRSCGSHPDASRRVRCSLRGGVAPWFELFRNAVKAGVLRGPEELHGPPAPSLWGPVGFVSAETGPRLSALIGARIDSLGLGEEPEDLSRAMRDASMEITILLSPALRHPAPERRAA